MIILENRETKSATLCNNDLKRLCEYTNVVVSIDDKGEWVNICTSSNDYILVKVPASETTILRTDSNFIPYMSFVYDVEASEEEPDDNTSDTDNSDIVFSDVDDMSQESINHHNHEYLEINGIVTNP